MTKILIHAGFHKTGTTSLQTFLMANRGRLAPHARVYLGEQLGEARRLGRLYGERPFPWRRRAFRRGLDDFLASIPDDDVILISRESFSGAMLGATRLGRPITRYAPMAVPLARALVKALRHRFGAGAEIELLYTVRGRDSFLRSIWGHQLRTKRLTQDLDAFAARFAPGFDLRAEAAQIAAALAPVPVHVRALEDARGDPLGPGRFVLDLLGLGPEGFARPTDRHRGPSAELAAQFLELNRTRPKGRALRNRKEALLAEERARPDAV